ncbi:hypothetical protein GCM10020000_01440 [Streptomyces olivoverticillatus]
MIRRSWFTALAVAVVSVAGLTAAPAALASPAAQETAPHALKTTFKGVHPELNGLRVKGINGPEIYLILDGRRHWIPNPATYNNLFRDWNGIQTIVDPDSIDNGGQLSDGAFLGKSPNAPEVYLISNGVKRWITSPAAMDKYYFNWNRIKYVEPVALQAIPQGGNIS